jgi:hypothetical protein
MATLREALESAMDKQQAAAAPEPAPQASEPVQGVEAPTTVGPVSEPVPPMGETAEAKAERLRNEDGTFAKAPKESKVGAKSADAAPKGVEKAGKGEAAAPVEAKAGGVPPNPLGTPPAPAAAPKVPASFRPAARELAQKLPAEFHPLLEESIRIDNEAKRALNESTQARQLAQRVQQSLAPYETLARANGMDAMTYAGTVLQSAAALQMGTQAQKDALIANLIATYGGSIEGINAHLSGQAPPVSQQQPPVNIQAELDRLWESKIGQIQETAAQQKAAEFIDSAPEFLQDVWPDMVEILRVAESRNQKMDYQQAYDRACRFNEDVSKILEQRKAAKAATAQNAATQRSVDAASGVKTNPATAPSARPRDLRAALEYEADRQGIR